MQHQSPVSITLKRYESLGLLVPGMCIAVALTYWAYVADNQIVHPIIQHWLAELSGSSKTSTSTDLVWQMVFLTAIFVLFALMCGNVSEGISKYLVETLSFDRVMGYPYQSLLNLHWFKYRNSITLDLEVDRDDVQEPKDPKKWLHLTKASRLLHTLDLISNGKFNCIKKRTSSEFAEKMPAFDDCSYHELIKSEGPKLITHLVFLKASLIYGCLLLALSSSVPTLWGWYDRIFGYYSGDLIWSVAALVATGAVLFFIRHSKMLCWLYGLAALAAATITGYWAGHWSGALCIPVLVTFLVLSIYSITLFVLCTWAFRKPQMHDRRVELLGGGKESSSSDKFRYVLGDLVVKPAWRQEQLAFMLYRVAGIHMIFPTAMILDIKKAYEYFFVSKTGEKYNFGSDKLDMYNNSEPYWASYWLIERLSPVTNDKINKYVNMTAFHRNMIGAMIFSVPLFGLSFYYSINHGLAAFFIILIGSPIFIAILWMRFVYFYVFTTKMVLRQMVIERKIRVGNFAHVSRSDVHTSDA